MWPIKKLATKAEGGLLILVQIGPVVAIPVGFGSPVAHSASPVRPNRARMAGGHFSDLATTDGEGGLSNPGAGGFLMLDDDGHL